MVGHVFMKVLTYKIHKSKLSGDFILNLMCKPQVYWLWMGSGSAEFDSDGRAVPGLPGHITKANQA